MNGSTIRFLKADELPSRAVFYHVETENHVAIIANGAPAETFVDERSRSDFDNYQEYLDLYGVERIIPEMTRPRISSARLVPKKIRQQLGINDHVAINLMLTA